MALINATSCWYPDGATDGVGQTSYLVPCDPLAPVSACCAVGESCTGNGFCYSDNGNIYRGACTDKSWKSEVCPYYCRDPANSFSTVYSCVNGSAYGCSSDCSQTFTLQNLGIRQVNITGLVQTAVSSQAGSSQAVLTVIQTATATAVSSSCPTSGSDAAAIGAGVGVPLGILLLAALASTFWFRKKWMQERRSSSEVPLMQFGEHSSNASGPGNPKVTSTPRYNRSSMPMEMSDEAAKIEASDEAAMIEASEEAAKIEISGQSRAMELP